MKHTLLMGLVALCVAGCGAGSGGTGSGNEISLADFGATAVPVCQARIASSLACPPIPTQAASSPPDVAVQAGTQPLRFADVATGAKYTAQFNANSVVLDARCLGLNFAGEWGIKAQGDGAYFGSYLLDGVGQRVAASLTVDVDGDGSAGALLLSLRDVNGRLVLPPIRVVPVPAVPVAPSAC